MDNVFVTAEELAVIVPIPEAVLADSEYDLWAEVRPRVSEAFGRAIDAAAFFGTNKPTSWPEGIVPAAIAAGNVALHNSGASGSSFYQEISGRDGLIAKVEDQGIAVTGYVGALQLRALLRGATDANGQPIFRTAYSNGAASATPYELEGNSIRFPANGAWDAGQALLARRQLRLRALRHPSGHDVQDLRSGHDHRRGWQGRPVADGAGLRRPARGHAARLGAPEAGQPRLRHELLPLRGAPADRCDASSTN